MSYVIGSCAHSKSGGWWEVFSDGKAYADTGEVAYRWSDGTWNTLIVRGASSSRTMVDDSEKLERAYARFVAGITIRPHERRGSQ